MGPRQELFGDPPGTFCIGVYIDNIYTMVCTGSEAVAMARHVEQLLKFRWDLSIKDGSREHLIPRGSVRTTSDPDFE